MGNHYQNVLLVTENIVYTVKLCGYMHIGAKYHKANDVVRVILRDGSIKRMSAPNSVAELSDEGQEMCQYVSEVSCLSLVTLSFA